ALRGELRDAARLRRVIHRKAIGGVLVIDGAVPAAHAVGGVVTMRGAVVLTSSMVELLDADERAAVVAHERAHLRQRHTLFMAALRLSAALNPLLGGMLRDVRFALERWLGEGGAAGTGPATLSSALARAARGVPGGSGRG